MREPELANEGAQRSRGFEAADGMRLKERLAEGGTGTRAGKAGTDRGSGGDRGSPGLPAGLRQERVHQGLISAVRRAAGGHGGLEGRRGSEECDRKARGGSGLNAGSSGRWGGAPESGVGAPQGLIRTVKGLRAGTEVEGPAGSHYSAKLHPQRINYC